MKTPARVTFLMCALASCDEVPGVQVLGGGEHVLEGNEYVKLSDRLKIANLETDDTVGVGVALSDVRDTYTAYDLAFDPTTKRLWVPLRDPAKGSDRDEDVMLIYTGGLDEGTPSAVLRSDPLARQTMDQPMALAFTGDGRFGSCGETRHLDEVTGDSDDFAGPSLWISSLDVFGKAEAGETSAIDALHDSPNCMGVAWETERVFWVFDGCGGRQLDSESMTVGDCEGAADLVRYDFGKEGAPGLDGPADGEIRRIRGIVSHEAGVPSHLAIDRRPGKRKMYVADTGNQRVLVIDLDFGWRGETLPAADPGVDHFLLEGFDCAKGDGCSIFVDRTSMAVEARDQRTVRLEAPSGLALFDEKLFVSDFATGMVYAFDLRPDADAGEALPWASSVDYLDMGREGIAGLEFDARGDLYVASTEERALLRLSPVRP